METSIRPTSETRRPRVTIDPAAIAENWRFFRKRAPGAICAAVVKADSYGLGADVAANALAGAGARVFFVASLAEGLAVRKALGQGPQILVLNGPSKETAGKFTPAKLTPVLNSLQQIHVWAGRGPSALHLDTGMNRLGIGADELGAASLAVQDVSLSLVMSHLACASALDDPMNALQRKRFIAAAQQFPKAPLSLAASSGTLLGPDYHFDLIRPGIGLYGSGGLDKDNPPLMAAATLEAPIIQVRDVEAGETFGYGATFTATKKMRSATVAIGYADGFLRSLAGRGYGVLGGARRPILGRVSMDLIILDVTGCADAEPGVMVEFLGRQARLDDVAACAGTIPYEILTTMVGTARRTGGAS